MILGQHRLLCADLTDVTPLSTLCAGGIADVTYTDPPWGEGLLRWFYTHRGGAPCPVSWDVFLSRFADAVATHTRRNGHIFVEMGAAWIDDMARAMSIAGRPERARWTVTYGSPRRPSVLWHSGPALDGDPTGLHGRAVPRWALSRVVQAGTVVLDPCCGKGTTAAVTHALGGTFWGMELNPRRLAVTERILAR